jgi:hypothetical protein
MGRQAKACSFHATQCHTLAGPRPVRCVTIRDPPGRRFASTACLRRYKIDALGRELSICASGRRIQA